MAAGNRMENAMLQFEPLPGPFGRAVRGVDLAAGVDDDAFRALSRALYEHRVLVLKEQTCDEDAYLAFGRRWGAPIPHVLDHARMPGYPEMLEVGNDTQRGREDDLARNSAAFWHTDQSYEADIATATMLYARAAPDRGGETRIADQKAAYDGLDAATRARIDGLVAVHLYGAASGRDGERATKPLTEAQAARVPPVPHPLVRRHGVTGEKALYAVAGTPIAIEGMDDGAAAELLAELKAHAVGDRYVYAHSYEVGDVAIWDTQATLHCATPIGPPAPGNRRLLWRISVRGAPPIYA